jgi:hypothetical protein
VPVLIAPPAIDVPVEIAPAASEVAVENPPAMSDVAVENPPATSEVTESMMLPMFWGIAREVEARMARTGRVETRMLIDCLRRSDEVCMQKGFGFLALDGCYERKCC